MKPQSLILKFASTILLLTNSINVFSQIVEYYKEDYFRYENHIYDDNIHTVQLNLDGNVLSPPIISLGGNEKLRFSFDDLGDEHKSYYYTLIHCNANWVQSDLFPTEYIQGVTEDVIYENSYSRGGNIDYVHHWLVFPTENMKIIRSGNYLIKVYEEGDPENSVITWRFMISENRIEVNGRVFPTTEARYHAYRQELNFSIFSEKYLMSNPYDDLKITIQQNGRWDNAHYNVNPTFVKGNEIEFINQKDLIFDGGNEFRFFNMKNIDYASGYIDKIYTDSNGVKHSMLRSEKKRAYKTYSQYIDINGRRYIQNDSWGNDNNVDAEYSWVHFSLPTDQIKGGEVFVYGELTDWECKTKNKLSYNLKESCYQGKILLKQGYYNYEYAFVEYGKNLPNTITIEGMHSETENDYTILVYHRQLSDDYDRLIAVKTINSTRSLDVSKER